MPRNLDDMTRAEALEVLGLETPHFVARDHAHALELLATWKSDVVKPAFRVALRNAHPDQNAGEDGGTARVVAARDRLVRMKIAPPPTRTVTRGPSTFASEVRRGYSNEIRRTIIRERGFSMVDIAIEGEGNAPLDALAELLASMQREADADQFDRLRHGGRRA